MATTFANLLASLERDWCIFAQIEGVGPQVLSSGDYFSSGFDSRYRFCTGIPTIGSDGTQPAELWLPYLTQVPELLSEDVNEDGGIAEYGATSIAILDVGDFLTNLLRTESFPFTVLDGDMTIATTTMPVAATTGAAVNDAIFVDGEAFRVSSITAGVSYSVDKSYHGTRRTVHKTGAVVYKFLPFLRGRVVEISAMPLGASAWSQRREVAKFTVDQVSFDRPLNSWVFQARSEIQFLDGLVPTTPRSATVTSVANGASERPVVGLALNANVGEAATSLQVWTGAQATVDRLFYLAIEDEVVSVASGELSTGITVTLADRALAGTRRQTPEANQVAKQVFVADPRASSFRYSPPPSPSPLRTSGTWIQSDHWVDIALCILTSVKHPDDDIELANFDEDWGNWASLPAGYGLGILATDIDWASWIDAKQRTDEFRFPNFVLGRDSRTGLEIIQQEFLEPLGAFMVIAASKLRVILPSSPLALEATTAVTTADVITTEVDGVRLPDLTVRRDLASVVSDIRYTVGPGQVDVGARVSRPGRDTATRRFAVPSANNEAGPTWAARAEARTARRRTPATEVAGTFDARLWDTSVGDVVSLTIPEIPDPIAGVRGWTAVQCRLFQREIRALIEEGALGVHLFYRLKAYSPLRTTFRVAPSGFIGSVSSNTATLGADRYTCSDATGLPVTDAAAFSVGDVCYLLNPRGDRVTTLTQAITAISGDDITFDGNFSGTLATGLIIAYADYTASTTTQRGSYAYAGNRDTGTIGVGVQARFYGEI